MRYQLRYVRVDEVRTVPGVTLKPWQWTALVVFIVFSLCCMGTAVIGAFTDDEKPEPRKVVDVPASTPAATVSSTAPAPAVSSTAPSVAPSTVPPVAEPAPPATGNGDGDDSGSGGDVAPAEPGDVRDRYYANCTAAKNAGAAPLRRGRDDGYRSALDRDGDGIACDK